MTCDRSNALPAELLEFQSNARRTWYFYATLAIGALFMMAPLLIESAKDYREHGCPTLLQIFMSALGSVFFFGSLYALIRNVEWGSKIDMSNPAVVWWHGPTPASRHRIAIEEITLVRIERSSDTDQLLLFGRDGNRLYFPNECARPPLHLWAGALAQRFAHIRCESR